MYAICPSPQNRNLSRFKHHRKMYDTFFGLKNRNGIFSCMQTNLTDASVEGHSDVEFNVNFGTPSPL
jgi:hypothetical protein